MPSAPRRPLSRVVAAVLTAALTFTLLALDPDGARPAVAQVPVAQLAASVIDGPDVASYQHPNGARIDWHKVAHEGHEFAIIKATEGHFYKNPWFRRDYRDSRRAGLVRGSYHFARPAYPVVRTARAQARFYADRLGHSPGTVRTLPPVLDLEATGGLRRGALVVWAQQFLLAVRRLTGRTPMLYTYPYFWSSSLGDPQAFARFPLWMASYDEPVSHVTDDATLWQYTAGASVRGIRGRVDMSRLVADAEIWPQLADHRQALPWAPAVPGDVQHLHADASAGRATISWLPGDSGSHPVDRYVITGEPGGIRRSVPGTQLTATFGSLHNGTTYTFSVTPVNRLGASDVAGPARDVKPMIPARLSPMGPTQVGYGHRSHVHVRLARPDTGHGLGGRLLTVERRAVGGSWAPWRTLTTANRGGTDVVLRRPLESFDLRYSYAGTQATRAATQVVHVVVHNTVSAGLSKHRVHSSHAVTMRGHIRPRTAGVEVRRLSYVRHHWRVAQRATTKADGSYAFRFRPHARHRTTRYYKVVVSAFGHRVRGYSPTRHVRVHH